MITDKWLFTDLDNPLEKYIVESKDPIQSYCDAIGIYRDLIGPAEITPFFEDGLIKLIIEDCIKIEPITREEPL